MIILRKFALLVLVFATSSLAWADQITFHIRTMAYAVTLSASSTGLTAGPALNFLVSDDTTGISFPVAGILHSFTGPASSFTIFPNVVLGTFDGAGPNSVQITDLGGHTLLSGEVNDGAALVAAYPNGGGAFLASFSHAFVNPSILALFGQDLTRPDGAVALTFAESGLVGSTLEGTIGGGSITVETFVGQTPEPSTLALAGTGLLMATGFVRRKRGAV